jgi:AcrR family transcriptional regulator
MTEPQLKHKPSATTDKGIERAQEVLAAARALVVAEGFACLSMRRVAAEAGMSLSNVQHYFSSKEALTEAVMLGMLAEIQDRVDRIGQLKPASPADRFAQAIDLFLDEVANPQLQALMLECWGLALHQPSAAALMDKMRAREVKTIYQLLDGLMPNVSDAERKTRAELVVAFLQGLLTTAARSRFHQLSMPMHAAARAAVMRLATDRAHTSA